MTRVRKSTYRQPVTPKGLESIEKGTLQWFDTEMYSNLNTEVLEEYLDHKNRKDSFRVSSFKWWKLFLVIILVGLVGAAVFFLFGSTASSSATATAVAKQALVVAQTETAEATELEAEATMTVQTEAEAKATARAEAIAITNAENTRQADEENTVTVEVITTKSAPTESTPTTTPTSTSTPTPSRPARSGRPRTGPGRSACPPTCCGRPYGSRGPRGSFGRMDRCRKAPCWCCRCRRPWACKGGLRCGCWSRPWPSGNENSGRRLEQRGSGSWGGRRCWPSRRRSGRAVGSRGAG